MARKRVEDIPEEIITPVKNVDFIITGDIHLREDQPVCRTDDFLKTQERKIKWLSDLQKQYGVPILDSGDLFTKARPTPTLLKWAIENIPAQFHTIPGNHDLPEHNLDNLDKSGFGVLVAAKAICDITGKHDFGYGIISKGVPWGASLNTDFFEILIWHVMTYCGEKPWPQCRDTEAHDLLRLCNARTVITGHNHVPFVIEQEDQLLVNPGSLFRTTAAQVNHRPRVYLFDQINNKVQPVYVPIEQGVVSRDHIEKAKGKEERLSVFISKLSENVELGLNYQHNLEKYMDDNNVRRAVRALIEEAAQ